MYTMDNITCDIAEEAVRAYNCGEYRGSKNPVVDERARDIFAAGLGATLDSILRQVRYIGDDYGGVAGFPSALALAPNIASDILGSREVFDQAARSAPAVADGMACRESLAVLYAPFIKPLHGKKNWQVWATKFWHFLNPDAFPLEDSRVDKFF